MKKMNEPFVYEKLKLRSPRIEAAAKHKNFFSLTVDENKPPLSLIVVIILVLKTCAAVSFCRGAVERKLGKHNCKYDNDAKSSSDILRHFLLSPLER